MKKTSLFLALASVFGIVIITRAQSVPSYIPSNGLLAWYPFSGNANDQSGNGHNGTNNGAVLTSDRNGQINSAYSFNGTSSGIFISDNVNFRPLSYAVSCWVQCNSLSGIQHIVTKNIGTGVLQSIGLFTYQNNFWSWMCTSTTLGYPFDSGYPPTLGQWYNFVDQFDDVSNIHSIYINGVFTASVVETINMDYDTRDWTIGMEYENNIQDFFFSGKIDDIGIWNRTLTQQEITNLYNSCQLSVATQPINQIVNISSNAQFAVASSTSGVTYQWQTDIGFGFQNLSNAGQYSNVNTSSLTVSNITLVNNNQQFRCLIVSGSCTTTSNAAVLTVLNTTGINENTTSHAFSIYPNPNTGVIYINNLKDYQVEIHDLLGKKISTTSVPISETKTELSLDNLTDGIYILQIYNAEKYLVQSTKISVRK